MGARVRILFAGLIAFGVGAPAFAADIQAGPGDYLDAAANLRPGDTLHLAAGEYLGCLPLFGMHGEPAARIVISGPESGAPAVFRGAGCIVPNNPRDSVIVFLRDASYITVRHLELDAQSMEVSGVRAGFGTTPVHNITLEHLYIHDNDVSNQPSGISSFATAWDWVIRDNRIERTGLGMYLGDSDGTDPFIAATIEHNVILNPRGYGMQIKHQNPRESVAGMPQADSVTLIRHNVFIKQSNAALGNEARPNLLVGAFPSSGIGANDRYEIYGNLFFENQTDVEPLFQGEGNLAFHDNVLVNSFMGTGILIQPHNGVPKAIDVYRNTIVTAGVGISLVGGDAMFQQRLRGNVVFANGMPAITGGIQEDNVTGTLLDAASALVDPTPVLGQLDLYPSADGTIRGAAIDWSDYAAHVDVDLDFDSRPRDGTYRGAYAGSGVNPGWRLAATNKPRAGPMPPRDGGVDDRGVRDAGSADGSGRPDASADASVVPPDAGAPGPVDGGVEVDAGSGSEPEPTGTGGGCRCVEPEGSSPAAWLAFLGLLAFGRRRHR